MKASLSVGLVASAIAVGCGGTTTTTAVCKAGEQIACSCPGGTVGAQRCASDGSGYGDCEGCSSTTSSSSSSSGTGGVGGALPGAATKIDLLLDVDNSRSMADKQQILAAALPDLVRRIVNPVCVDPNTGAPGAAQPAGPTDPCPVGTKRQFAPILDVHIGVITTSIGGHGSDACPSIENFSCPGGTNATNNDLGHLVSRLDPCAGGTVSTYQNQGFLAWDPAAAQTPPGEASLGSVNINTTTGAVTTVTPGLVPALKDLVVGAGQVGCGYESQLESWYRFLVDPDPYQTIAYDPAVGKAVPEGTDQVLLQQRKDFLRPSSVLAVVLLSDENDCSIKEYGQFFYAAQQRDPLNPAKSFHLPRARSECATNPADACCLSCGQNQASCPPDPGCNGLPLTDEEDPVSLRCWEQKRRFGIDFLYPIDRYVTGLTQPFVPNRQGDIVANPIFSDLDLTDADNFIRTPHDVFFTAIVGVPWQDLAKDPHDLKVGYKSPSELALLDDAGHSAWDYVIGNPAGYVAALDPLMIEANAPRTGTNPITGYPLAPPSTTPGPGPNPINGHEYTPNAADDLEYACIFPLWQPRDCGVPGAPSCDCNDPKNDNPLCEPDPSKNNDRTLQVRAKAYPGVRELTLVKALAEQGVAGSVCPAQIEDPAAADFGYRPVVGALIDRMKTRLAGQ